MAAQTDASECGNESNEWKAEMAALGNELAVLAREAAGLIDGFVRDIAELER